MAPKKKASEVGGPSASHPPLPEPTAGGGDAVGRVAAGEDARGATRSKDRTDDRASVSVGEARPSQQTTTQQRHVRGGGIRLLGQGQTGGSWDAPCGGQGQPGGGGAPPTPRRGKKKGKRRGGGGLAPSNAVGSLSKSRS